MRTAFTAGRLGAALAAALLAACAGAGAASASPWHLVASFGRDGVAGLPVRERRQEPPNQGAPSPPERLRSLLAAGPGSTVYVGGFAESRPGAFLLARITASGRLDRGFGSGGVLQLPDVWWFAQDPPRLLALAGGSLLVVGLDRSDRLVAIRLSARGTLDRSFGHDGIARYALAHAQRFTILTAAVAEPDGDILAVYQKELPQPVNQPRVPEGQGNGVVRYVRLLPSGALDPSFGSGGFVAAPAKELALLEGESGTLGACAETLAPDGSLLVAWEQFALEELDPAGVPVAGFAAQAPPSAQGPGYQTRNSFHFCDGLFALAGGKVEGVEGRRFVRLTAAGAPDPAFGGGTVTLGAPVSAAAVAADGETFSAGSSGGRLLLAGILADGAPDGALGGSRGTRFAAAVPPALDEEQPSWEVLPGSGALTVRVGEELVRLAP